MRDAAARGLKKRPPVILPANHPPVIRLPAIYLKMIAPRGDLKTGRGSAAVVAIIYGTTWTVS